MIRTVTRGFRSVRDEENKAPGHRLRMLVRKITYALKYQDHKYVTSAVTDVRTQRMVKKDAMGGGHLI